MLDEGIVFLERAIINKKLNHAAVELAALVLRVDAASSTALTGDVTAAVKFGDNFFHGASSWDTIVKIM